MPVISKNIPEPKEDTINIPLMLLKKKQNYEAAGYNYGFDPKETRYIDYNTLRMKRQDKEILEVVKMYRLQDRDTGQEYIVWYQKSKVYDFNNNLRKCPINECIGVVDRPQTNQVLDASNQVTDIVPIETQIEYTNEFNPEEVKKLLAKSRNAHQVACYVGYTKPYKLRTNDFIENKRRINSQNKFLDGNFDDLISINDSANLKESFNIRKWKEQYGSNKEQRRTQENKQSSPSGRL